MLHNINADLKKKLSALQSVLRTARFKPGSYSFNRHEAEAGTAAILVRKNEYSLYLLISGMTNSVHQLNPVQSQQLPARTGTAEGSQWSLSPA
jgi:hypothetical protein